MNMAFDLHGAADAKGADPERASLPLSELALATEAEVLAIDVEDAARPWLEAVGISVGERVHVLRRALFGGPLHVRTRAGGEFALARKLARAVRVRCASAEAP